MLIFQLVLLTVLSMTAWKVMDRKTSVSIADDRKGDTVNTDFDKSPLKSQSVYLMDREDQNGLLDIQGKKRIYPASMTKIMTVYLAAESGIDMEAPVTLPKSFAGLYKQNASMAGFFPGERVLFKDLLYGAMMPSGADACLGIAEEMAGSEEEFVKLMNKKAKELGMSGTHFTNADGLHHPEHYSTVRDIAKLLDAALGSPEFYEVFTARSYVTSPTEEHPDGIWMEGTMYESLPDAAIEGGKILGGKTGYTDEAGLCLASLAVKNGKEYILVTAKAPGNHQTEPFHTEDALYIYNHFLKLNVQSKESGDIPDEAESTKHYSFTIKK